METSEYQSDKHRRSLFCFLLQNSVGTIPTRKKKKKLQESSHASDVSLFDLYSCKYGHHLNFAPGKRNWSDDNQIRGVQCHFHVCLSNTVKHSDNTQKCLQTRKQNCVHPPTNKIDDTCETRLQAEVVLP